MGAIGPAMCWLLFLIGWSIGNSVVMWEITAYAATPGSARWRIWAPALLTWWWLPVLALVITVAVALPGAGDRAWEVLTWSLLVALAIPPAATILVLRERNRRRREDRLAGRPRVLRRR
jgi:pilus assembly protein TadC